MMMQERPPLQRVWKIRKKKLVSPKETEVYCVTQQSILNQKQ